MTSFRVLCVTKNGIVCNKKWQRQNGFERVLRCFLGGRSTRFYNEVGDEDITAFPWIC